MLPGLYKFRCSVCSGDDTNGCVLWADCSVVPDTCPFEGWGYSPETKPKWVFINEQ